MYKRSEKVQGKDFLTQPAVGADLIIMICRLSNGSSGRTSAGREIMFFKHLVTDIYHPSFWFSVITFPLTERVLKISQESAAWCINSVPGAWCINSDSDATIKSQRKSLFVCPWCDLKILLANRVQMTVKLFCWILVIFRKYASRLKIKLSSGTDLREGYQKP